MMTKCQYRDVPSFSFLQIYFLVCLTLLSCSYLLCQQLPDAPIIGSLQIKEMTLEECLIHLQRKVNHQVVFGFEKSPTDHDNTPQRLTLSMENVTLKKVLDAIVRLDTRYEYRISPSGRIIMVYPEKALEDKGNLLNVQVRQIEVDLVEFPQTLIRSCHLWIPELKETLYNRRQQYRNASNGPSGVVSSLIKGNAPAPKVQLRLRDQTVRSILNEIAAWSQENAAAMGWRHGCGWKYECTPNERSPSGLGCDPRWEIF